MDFSGVMNCVADTEEQASWRAKVRAFLEREFVPHIEEWEEEGERTGMLSREAYRTLCRFGFAVLDVPVDAGGLGLGDDMVSIAWQEVERAVRYEHVEIEFMFTIGRALALEALELGDLELFERAKRGDDSIAHAVTEYRGGSDFAYCETRAVRDGDVYVVNGEKDLVSCVPGHNWLRVLVQTAPEAYASGDRHHALSVLLVDSSLPGVTIKPVTTPDLRAWHSLASVELRDVRVPRDRLLGEENQGFYRIASGFGLRGIGDSGEFSGERFAALVREGVAAARQHTAGGNTLLADSRAQRVLIDGMSLAEVLKVSGWYTGWLANVGSSGQTLRHSGGSGKQVLNARVSPEELSGWGAKRRVLSKQDGHQFRIALLSLFGSDVASRVHPMFKSYVAHLSQKARGGGVETHKFQIARAYYGKEFDSRT